MVAWLLFVFGLTTVVTQSKLFLPFRVWFMRKTCRRYTSPVEVRPILVPTSWSTFFDCPMCVGFWVGLVTSWAFGWGLCPGTLGFFRPLADGFCSSATCWIGYVVLHNLGAGKL